MRGGPFLQRVLNLSGPQDFRGEVGEEVWNAAVALGNWCAAAIVARGGYKPPGQEPVALFLIRNHLAACDFDGSSAASRLWTSLHNLSSSDEAQSQEFIVEMGRPWKEGALNVALFLAAHFRKGPGIIRLLCEAGGQIDARWESVRDWLLDSVALTPADWVAKRDAEQQELLRVAGMDESASLILQMEHTGATPLIWSARRHGRVHPWIEGGADLLAADARGRTALHHCAEQGDWCGVRSLLAARSSGWDTTDLDGNRPLDLAMKSRYGRVLDALLEAGSSPLDARRDPGEFESGAALRLALWNGVEHPRTADGAKKMLSLLPVEERYSRPEERLFRALENYYPDLVQLLLTAGVEPRFSGPGQQTCLHAAARNGDVQSVRLLLTVASVVAGANAANEDGYTPLHLACRDGGAVGGVLAALLAAGALPCVVDRQQRNCLHLLAGANDDVAAANAVPGLLEAGAALEGADSDGNTPLACAIRSARPALANALLNAGANPNTLVGGVCNALGFCASAGEVRMLISAGAKLSCSDAGVAEALLRQASYGSLDTFEVFLRAVKHPCTAINRRSAGETLLHRVAWSDQSPAATRVEWVLAICNSVDPRDGEGKTPLMAAARYGTEEAVRRLLDAGANPGAKDTAGLSVAAHARASSRWDLADLIEAR